VNAYKCGPIAILALSIDSIDVDGRPAGAIPDREGEAVIPGDAEILVHIESGTRSGKRSHSSAYPERSTYIDGDADRRVRHVEIGRPA
jgi:hypothetical protein